MSDTGDTHRTRLRGNGARRPDPESNRRAPDAATVSSRWWEVSPDRSSSPSQAPSPPLRPDAATLPAGKAPPPPPPPAARPGGLPRQDTAKAGDVAENSRLERLEQELAAARDEATALHEMLEDLPEIFERKFRQRLQGVMEQQRLLLADNRMLRDQLYALQPAPSELETRPSRLLPPAATPPAGTAPRPEQLRRLLRGVRRLVLRLQPGGSGSSGAPAADFSDAPDAGPPTAA